MVLKVSSLYSKKSFAIPRSLNFHKLVIIRMLERLWSVYQMARWTALQISRRKKFKDTLKAAMEDFRH